MSLKDLTGTEIVVRASGTVEESNLGDFEKEAEKALSSINTTLITDEDFGNAKTDIESCRELEKRLVNIGKHIVSGMAEVAEVTDLLGDIQAKFRSTRLSLENKVKTEEAKRKKQIVDNGLDIIHARIDTSPCKHGFKMDRAAVYDAIKYKKSLAKMQEAVEGVVMSEVKRLMDLEDMYSENISTILAAEKNYPGLFPDKDTLALETTETVSAKVGLRIEKFKNDKRELEEKEGKATQQKKAVEAVSGNIQEPAFEPPVEPAFEPPPNPFTDTPNPSPVKLEVYISGFVNEEVVIDRIKKMTEVISVHLV